MAKKEHPFARDAAKYRELASQVAAVSFDAQEAERLQRIAALAERCKTSLALPEVTAEGGDIRPPAPHRAESTRKDGPSLSDA